jgi:hypothetical protein
MTDQRKKKRRGVTWPIFILPQPMNRWRRRHFPMHLRLERAEAFQRGQQSLKRMRGQ